MEDSLLPVAEKPGPDLSRLMALVLDSVSSPHSRRAYARAIADFLAWHRSSGRGPLRKALVQEYRAKLEADGLAPSSINVRLAAIRKLAQEAADNDLLAPEIAAGIARVRGARARGVRAGNWLTREQAGRLLDLPDRRTLRGQRDRALLALLLGCGLRRQELASLRLDDVQQRAGRWCIVDLDGKGNRVRTVPMPLWAKAALDEWIAAAGFGAGLVLGTVDKSGRAAAQGMTGQAIYDIIAGYGRVLGVKLAPHDIRRTFAKLAHQGRAPLEQIQITLGHASIQTTERYLGIAQDLADAPCDHLGVAPR